MSTVKQPLKYLWTAYFDDGRVIEQPADDRYSKHDDNADYNPSAFRDILDHAEKAKLIYFDINDGTFAYGIDLPSGRFGINGTWFHLEDQGIELVDRKLVYWREVLQESELKAMVDDLESPVIHTKEPYVSAYYFGYEGRDKAGNKFVKTICIK